MGPPGRRSRRSGGVAGAGGRGGRARRHQSEAGAGRGRWNGLRAPGVVEPDARFVSVPAGDVPRRGEPQPESQLDQGRGRGPGRIVAGGGSVSARGAAGLLRAAAVADGGAGRLPGVEPDERSVGAEPSSGVQVDRALRARRAPRPDRVLVGPRPPARCVDLWGVHRRSSAVRPVGAHPGQGHRWGCRGAGRATVGRQRRGQRAGNAAGRLHGLLKRAGAGAAAHSGGQGTGDAGRAGCDGRVLRHPLPRRVHIAGRGGARRLRIRRPCPTGLCGPGHCGDARRRDLPGQRRLGCRAAADEHEHQRAVGHLEDRLPDGASQPGDRRGLGQLHDRRAALSAHRNRG